jgi:hypothetical protein
VHVRPFNPLVFLVTWLAGVPVAATCLMLGAPLLHTVLGTPKTHPGWWVCLVLLVLVRVITRAAFTTPTAEPSDEEILDPASSIDTTTTEET